MHCAHQNDCIVFLITQLNALRDVSDDVREQVPHHVRMWRADGSEAFADENC